MALASVQSGLIQSCPPSDLTVTSRISVKGWYINTEIFSTKVHSFPDAAARYLTAYLYASGNPDSAQPFTITPVPPFTN